jgi:hypothetical protein
MSERLIPIVKQLKDKDPNVDFFSASAYYTMASRWTCSPRSSRSPRPRLDAHVMEQHINNRIIRPTDDYTAHSPEDRPDRSAEVDQITPPASLSPGVPGDEEEDKAKGASQIARGSSSFSSRVSPGLSPGLLVLRQPLPQESICSSSS